MKRPAEVTALVERLGYRDAAVEAEGGGWWSSCPVVTVNGDGPIFCGERLFVAHEEDGRGRFEPSCGHTVDEVMAAVASVPIKSSNGKPEPPSAPLRNPDPSTARPVRWAWRHRVAIGKLNLLVGNEGTGKGVVNAWQAARLSHGTA